MPRVVDHEARRRHVAELATKLIAEGGTDAATVREVARAAGTSTTVVSHYFRDKRELLEFTYRELATQIRARVDAALAVDVDDVGGVIEALLPLDDERLDFWRVNLAFWGRAVGDDVLTAEQRMHANNARDVIGSALGGADDPAAEIEADLLLAVVMGVAVQAVFDPGRWTPARQRAVIEALGIG